MTINIVVGGSSGIGKELVSKLLSRNERVVNLDINPSSELTDGDFNYRYSYMKLDLSDDESILNICKILHKKYHYQINNYYHCAGIPESPTSYLKPDFDEIDKIIQVNSSSIVKILSRLFGYACFAGGSSIVIVSSAHSQRAADQNPIYSASKGFIDSFVKSFSKTLITDHKKNGSPLVRINAVNPEMVSTPMTDSFFKTKDDHDNVAKSRILGRSLEIREVVDVMLFLSSDAASGITGNTTLIGGNI